MKSLLPVNVRFHQTPDGQKLLMLTCSETGRPIAGQYRLKTDYQEGVMNVRCEFQLYPEATQESYTDLVSGAVSEDPDEDYPEEDGYEVGF